jgi:hypothetical protein
MWHMRNEWLDRLKGRYILEELDVDGRFKMGLKKIMRECVNWTQLVQDSDGSGEHGSEPSVYKED